MALANYTDLTSAVEDWLAQSSNTALVTRVPDFIALTEKRLMYGGQAPMPTEPLRVVDMQSTSYADTVAAQNNYALPSDFLSARAIYIDSPRIELRYRTPFELHGFATNSGQPYFYTLQANQLVLSPTPVSVYKILLLYYADLPALTSSNTTNWLMTKAPNLYLYGALLEASVWLRDQEAMQMYGTLFSEAVNGYQEQDDKASTSGSALVMMTDVSGP